MNFFTDYRTNQYRQAVGPLYDGLDAVEEKVFQKDRARMKLKAIPPHRRRVLYGLEKELDPNLQLLMHDDPRAYYHDDPTITALHASTVNTVRHDRDDTIAADANGLLTTYPTAFKHKGRGVLKVKRTGDYSNSAMEAGDILVPIANGRMKNIGALKNKTKRARQATAIGLAADRADAKTGYYSLPGITPVTGAPIPVAAPYTAVPTARAGAVAYPLGAPGV